MLWGVIKNFRAELGGIKADLIRCWPNTKLGISLRQNYYYKKMNCRIKYIGQGSLIDRTEATSIGDNVVLGNNVTMVISGMARCYIGNDVAIAHGTYLRSANHNYRDMDKPILEQGHTWKKVEFRGEEYGIVIEDNVWIGANAIILSGAHICEGSVISAGSVVGSFIPPYSIAAGNPARVIANRKKLAEHAALVEKEIFNP